MSTNINDILKQLDSLNESTGIDVYVPSLKKTVKFKNLNLKQQKDLLKSSVDETLTKLSFIVNFFNIIHDNIIDKIDVNSLYAFDRSAIAIALRANGLNNEYTSGTTTINLLDVIKELSAIPVTDVFTTSIETNDISIDLEVPRLGYDRDISNLTINKLKTIQDRDIKSLVGELFVYEIIKYIKTVTFKLPTGNQAIPFNTLKIDEKISIIEKIPSTLTNKILQFIKTYRDLEGKFTTYGDTSIEIDGSFFSI
jgi:hypothetical protein